MSAGAGAVAGAVLGAIGTAFSIRKNNKKLAKAYLDQSKKMVKEYNYNIGALDNQQQSAFDATRVELFNLSVVGSKNISMVRTALGETGLEGRSHAQVEREVSGVLGMQKASTKEGYENVVKDLKVQRNNLYIQTNEALDSAYKSFKAQQTSVEEALIKTAMGAAQGASMGASIGSSFGGAPSVGAGAGGANKGLYTYNASGGYSYNMGYGSAGPRAYNFQTGMWE